MKLPCGSHDYNVVHRTVHELLVLTSLSVSFDGLIAKQHGGTAETGELVGTTVQAQTSRRRCQTALWFGLHSCILAVAAKLQLGVGELLTPVCGLVVEMATAEPRALRR